MNHKNDFLAHHAPWGSYSSFILGNVGMGGGFALSDVHSPNQSVYIAYRRGDELPFVFPFLGAATVKAEDFDATAANKDQPRTSRVLQPEEFERTYKWASDTWSHGGLRFSVLAPFGEVPELSGLSDLDRKLATCPCVIATLEFDNSGSTEPARVLFAMDGISRAFEVDTAGRLLGAAYRRSWGFAAKAGKNVSELQTFDAMSQTFTPESAFPANKKQHRLGGAGGLILEVAAGEKKTLVIALGAYQDGLVTSGQEASFAYTNDFPSLESALEFALEHSDHYIELAKKRDAELEASTLDANQQFLVAHATKGYLASTELLRRANDGQLLWIVNEGEYRMMNTLDLTIDHLFWEFRYHPWTTANVLEHFLDRYAFTDSLKLGGAGGISFPHDMGVSNAFSPPKESSYEVADLTGCFSHMTMEQLLNWVLCATCYGWKYDRAWLKQHADALRQCRDSIFTRDADGDGVMDMDTARVGTGMELTTYDNVDEALGRARSSTYLASKTWAALELLAACLESLGDDVTAVRERAASAVKTIVGYSQSRGGALPPHLDEAASKTDFVMAIPAVEGLVYALTNDIAIPQELQDVMRQHLEASFKRGCITERGGWQLSSGSHNTWMSKIFLNQFVAEQLGLKTEARAHEEHVRWQRHGSRLTGPTDQVASSDGAPIGSKLYPRLVTNVLWLEDAKQS
jgi:xylan 1,4-beta-xylosidase